MNELDILMLFYDEMKAKGTTRDKVFLNIDDSAVAKLSQKYGKNVTLELARKVADICIANEWLERTTIDPGYNFLSLTEAGLRIVLGYVYRPKT